MPKYNTIESLSDFSDMHLRLSLKALFSVDLEESATLDDVRVYLESDLFTGRLSHYLREQDSFPCPDADQFKHASAFRKVTGLHVAGALPAYYWRIQIAGELNVILPVDKVGRRDHTLEKHQEFISKACEGLDFSLPDFSLMTELRSSLVREALGSAEESKAEESEVSIQAQLTSLVKRISDGQRHNIAPRQLLNDITIILRAVESRIDLVDVLGYLQNMRIPFPIGLLKRLKKYAPQVWVPGNVDAIIADVDLTLTTDHFDYIRASLPALYSNMLLGSQPLDIRAVQEEALNPVHPACIALDRRVVNQFLAIYRGSEGTIDYRFLHAFMDRYFNLLDRSVIEGFVYQDRDAINRHPELKVLMQAKISAPCLNYLNQAYVNRSAMAEAIVGERTRLIAGAGAGAGSSDVTKSNPVIKAEPPCEAISWESFIDESGSVKVLPRDKKSRQKQKKRLLSFIVSDNKSAYITRINIMQKTSLVKVLESLGMDKKAAGRLDEQTKLDDAFIRVFSYKSLEEVLALQSEEALNKYQQKAFQQYLVPYLLEPLKAGGRVKVSNVAKEMLKKALMKSLNKTIGDDFASKHQMSFYMTSFVSAMNTEDGVELIVRLFEALGMDESMQQKFCWVTMAYSIERFGLAAQLMVDLAARYVNQFGQLEYEGIKLLPIEMYFISVRARSQKAFLDKAPEDTPAALSYFQKVLGTMPDLSHKIDIRGNTKKMSVLNAMLYFRCYEGVKIALEAGCDPNEQVDLNYALSTMRDDAIDGGPLRGTMGDGKVITLGISEFTTDKGLRELLLSYGAVLSNSLHVVGDSAYGWLHPYTGELLNEDRFKGSMQIIEYEERMLGAIKAFGMQSHLTPANINELNELFFNPGSVPCFLSGRILGTSFLFSLFEHDTSEHHALSEWFFDRVKEEGLVLSLFGDLSEMYTEPPFILRIAENLIFDKPDVLARKIWFCEKIKSHLLFLNKSLDSYSLELQAQLKLSLSKINFLIGAFQPFKVRSASLFLEAAATQAEVDEVTAGWEMD